MKTSDFDYSLPLELIAQTPIEPRDQSRLMVLNRSDSSMEHRKFFEITDYLRAGDVLLFNDSRVIPARLNGRKIDSGALPPEDTAIAPLQCIPVCSLVSCCLLLVTVFLRQPYHFR